MTGADLASAIRLDTGEVDDRVSVDIKFYVLLLYLVTLDGDRLKISNPC